MRSNTIDIFLNRIRKTKKCWEWISSKDMCGYGTFRWNGVQDKAHRWAWRIYKTEIPKGLCVLHKCDNPSCVRPSHLFLGTRKDNFNDMRMKGRQVNLRGEDHGSSKLRNFDVYRIRKLYKTKAIKISELSKIFSMHHNMIRRIVKRESWKCI